MRSSASLISCGSYMSDISPFRVECADSGAGGGGGDSSSEVPVSSLRLVVKYPET